MKKRKIFFYERRKVLYALLLCIACFLNVSLVMAQNVTVKGVVNDAYGPVIGANIVDKDNPTRAERKAMIKAGFLATLPFFLATVCAFVALMLLMTLWLG